MIIYGVRCKKYDDKLDKLRGISGKRNGGNMGLRRNFQYPEKMVEGLWGVSHTSRTITILKIWKLLNTLESRVDKIFNGFEILKREEFPWDLGL